MKANQFATEEEAQVGIGTMIVFIATILVAAVAAGVLIDTSQKLQDKSTQTGTDAIQGVGSALIVEAVMGDRHGSPAAADGIDELLVRVSLAAGAEPVDLKDVIVQVQTSAGLIPYTFDNTVASGSGFTQEYATTENYADIPDNKFWVTPLRDTDASLVDLDSNDGNVDPDTLQGEYDNHVTNAVDVDVYYGVLNDDDVALILIGQYDTDVTATPAGDDTNLDIDGSETVKISLVAGNGAVATAGFETPDTYGEQEYFVLF